jgi:hypothetical protein
VTTLIESLEDAKGAEDFLVLLPSSLPYICQHNMRLSFTIAACALAFGLEQVNQVRTNTHMHPLAGQMLEL